MTRLMVLFFVLFLSGCATVKSPLLWKIERDGKYSYLFGTIHVGVKAAGLPPSVFRVERIDGVQRQSHC